MSARQPSKRISFGRFRASMAAASIALAIVKQSGRRHTTIWPKISCVTIKKMHVNELQATIIHFFTISQKLWTTISYPVEFLYDLDEREKIFEANKSSISVALFRQFLF
jgi:hypothetical protein